MDSSSNTRGNLFHGGHQNSDLAENVIYRRRDQRSPKRHRDHKSINPGEDKWTGGYRERAQSCQGQRRDRRSQAERSHWNDRDDRIHFGDHPNQRKFSVDYDQSDPFGDDDRKGPGNYQQSEDQLGNSKSSRKRRELTDSYQNSSPDERSYKRDKQKSSAQPKNFQNDSDKVELGGKECLGKDRNLSYMQNAHLQSSGYVRSDFVELYNRDSAIPSAFSKRPTDRSSSSSRATAMHPARGPRMPMLAVPLPQQITSQAANDVHLSREILKRLCEVGGSLKLNSKDWTRFQQRVGIPLSGSMENFFDRFPHIFSCEDDDADPACKIIRCKVDLELCRNHCRKDGCNQLICDGLHCCKFFLYGTCKFGTECKFGHDLTNGHNRLLLKKYLLEDFSPNEIGIVLKLGNSSERFPTTCKFYNNEGGCERSDKCQHLHVCRYYVMWDRCKYGKHCKRSHNIYDSQPKRILAKYGVNVERSPKDVLNELRASVKPYNGSESGESSDGTFQGSSDSDEDSVRVVCHAASRPRTRTSSSDSTSSTRDSMEICTFYLRKKCNYGKACINRHPKLNLPYQWQYEDVNGEWKDFSRGSNDEIELNFCDPAKDECFIQNSEFSGVIGINFETMKCATPKGEYRKIHRLSTKSSQGRSVDHLYLTCWRWYWKEKKDNKWIEFELDDLNSEDLEEEYASNPSAHVPYVEGSVRYIVDLQTMKRKNMRSDNVTDVRRRPIMYDPLTKKPNHDKQSQPSSPTSSGLSNLKLGTVYPSTWDLEYRSDNEYFQIVPVRRGQAEFAKIEKLFNESVPQVPLKSIKRIQNAELWDGFYRKKLWMEKRLQPGQNLPVRSLFHGTKELYYDAICQQGFDWRMAGSSSGTKYGKGSYFARKASYSKQFCETRKLFVVQVLVGEYARGSPTMVRPPPKDMRHPFGDLYDSVVDDPANPNIFVVFSIEQAYPEYLIEY